MDKERFVNICNAVSINIPALETFSKLPWVSEAGNIFGIWIITKKDGSISRDLTAESRALLTSLALAAAVFVLCCFLGLVQTMSQLCSFSVAFYKSVKALEGDSPDTKAILSYLLIMATLTTIEASPLVIICRALPFYGLAKLVFLFVCAEPSTKVAIKVYETVGRPVLVILGEARSRAPDDVDNTTSTAASEDASHSFAVLIKDVSFDANDDTSAGLGHALYCIVEANNEGGGESVRYLTAPSSAQAPFSWNEALTLSFPSLWLTSGVLVLKVTIMRKTSIGTDSLLGACEYSLKRDGSKAGFEAKALDLPIKDVGEQECGSLSLEVRCN